ncbi:MAG: zinc ribbon domain-containing protein [Turicibacter sp.]
MESNYTCPKCGHTSYETDSISVTGSGLSKLFDVQNRSFSTVTCTRCKYTELYKASTNELANIFDLMIG